ncbi:heparan-alpha-glucosaminide N-acetyltransferase domain-containing protein [Pseudonocardia sediminis]|uniref:heparan-alpha-glucosaminide N-acetyltransferase domain-containing protein n=1 Tax=Pseudonocardia sediminis TaxID=1397368 RepID=UPI0010297E87|nr:heparan-alpha-glucosaminide N-acetyltransferase domain-containing protein [Pseudonocardia sediminis]
MRDEPAPAAVPAPRPETRPAGARPAEARPAAASATATPGRDTPVRTDESAASRLIGVDVARGLALFGIIAVHALVEGNEDGSPATNYLVFGGRSAALFALLAGVAFAFMTRRRRVRPGADLTAAAATLATRAGLLLVVGLALGWTDPEIAAVILPYYAIMFLLAIPLVLLPTGVLAGLTVVLAGGLPVLSALLRPALPVPTLDNPHLGDIFSDPLGLLSELTFTGAYPALTWVTYLCAGIAVGRLRLSSIRTALGLLGGGAAAALAATGASWYLLGAMGGYARIAAVTPPAQLETAPTIVDFVNASPDGVTPTTTWWWMATIAPHSGTPLDLVQTIGSALGVLGLALLLTHVPGRLIGYVLRPVAAAGSMTLTLYTLSLLYMNSGLDDFDPVPGYVFQVVAAMLIGVAWKRAVGRGPLEAAVSMLSHAARDRVRRGRGDRGRGDRGRSGKRRDGRDRVETPGASRAPVRVGDDRH